MPAILPGFTAEHSHMDPTQVKIYATEHYLLIGLFMFLLGLDLLNIYRIILKQGKWRTGLLLFFYIFSFISIVLRLVYLIVMWSDHTTGIAMIGDCQAVAKLCLGLIQSWTIFEICIRMRSSIRSIILQNGQRDQKIAQSNTKNADKHL